jgi:hypothetical protein
MKDKVGRIVIPPTTEAVCRQLKALLTAAWEEESGSCFQRAAVASQQGNASVARGRMNRANVPGSATHSVIRPVRSTSQRDRTHKAGLPLPNTLPQHCRQDSSVC